MIKIAHEAPIDIFEEIQRFTDYDYALVHLLEQNPRYRDTFERAIKKGREVILDNSIFELEEAFEADRFAQWIERLKPTWYIVPDALEDQKRTMNQMAAWNISYSNLPGKKIGVIQGKTYKQLSACYEYMDKMAGVDMIAISFDYSYYTETIPHPNKYVSWMLGRVKLLGDLLRDGIINENKPHHLLGCGLPQEFSFYKNAGYKWIYSLDTSNPVVHALKGVEYGSDGLWSKESQKLHELIDVDIENIDIDLVRTNVQKFRWFTNGQTPLGKTLTYE